jgi:hypothetical protein
MKDDTLGAVLFGLSLEELVIRGIKLPAEQAWTIVVAGNDHLRAYDFYCSCCFQLVHRVVSNSSTDQTKDSAKPRE